MRVLGIDTSCYTTSVALVEDGRIAQERRLLSVAQGERGLRQSSALFQHVERLPELLEALFAHSPGCVDGVCVSTRPRDAEGSYMPVFKAGECAARAIAAAQGVRIVATSHQQGHIRAALVDSGCGEAEFVALHLSGGTTEAVFVGQGLKTRLIAMSADLHAGQLVDRVGVALGLSFPAGPALEALARQGSAKGAMPLSHRGNQVSLSGAEAQAMRMIAAGAPGADVAAEVYSYLSRAVAKLIEIAVRETGAKQVLLGGGVASSALLRELLPARLKRNGLKVALCWGKPEYSGDNAVGVALIGYDRLTREDVQ